MSRLKNIVFGLIILSFFGCKNQDNRLKDGPRSPGSHGPLSASDFNRDGTVTKAEMEEFITMGPERKFGLIAYFELYDADENDFLNAEELAQVTPSFDFDGTDTNGDGTVSKNEVEDYVSDRLYRQMGLDDFFNLVDTNHDGEVSPAEIEAAHKNGQLPKE
ncbi:EF-hand domain-containing protein [Cellulophaga baltica]|nr:hypothetical protein [Cellulophaga baltica]